MSLHFLLRPSLAISLPAIALLVLANPHQAEACGGLFCDNTAQPMPVDQRGEDILFIQDGSNMEVHVRIQYTGEAEEFAWLVPIQGVPEVSVGSDPLFAELANAAGARWTTQTEYECEDDDPSSDTGGGGFVPSSDLAAPNEPEIVFDDTVGAFEVVVLQGGDAASVVEFLDINGYAQNPAAAPILQDYLDEGFLFAAVKLSAGAEADEIHPIIFRFPGDEPCVPLRLTAIAAEQDMGVRAYFLGTQRWAPLNYNHVVLNPLAFPWSEVGSSLAVSSERYKELLSLAVDIAGGQAFATDYAGLSSKVNQPPVYSESWDETAFIGLDPIEAIFQIGSQGLNTHPLIRALLMQFIPPPDDLEPQAFWNNIDIYADQIDLEAWDDQAFADALSERIIDPGLQAVDLLDAWPTLTRLHTTISPHEMTLDPTFQPTNALGYVDNTQTAQALELCDDAGAEYSVPFGVTTLVCLRESEWEWPATLSATPALRVEMIPALGPPQVLEDFEDEALAALGAHQIAQGCEQIGGSDDDGGEDAGEDAGDDDGSSTEGESDGGGMLSRYSSGCGCRSSEGGPSGAALGFLGLLLLGAGRARRRS